MLQVIAAIFVLAAPSVMGEIPRGTGIYFSAILFSAVLWLRVNATRKIDLSISHFVYLMLVVYAIITSFWAGNKEGNIIYIFAILVLMLFHSLSRDYFAENIAENIKRRMLYLLTISGVICAATNLIYWISKIVPVAGEAPLNRGLATNDFLAIFLYFSVLASLLLLKGNSKKRKIWLLLACIGIIFAFILAKSTVAWAFAIVFTIMLISGMYWKKQFMLVSVLGIFAFALFVMIWVSNSCFSSAFPEVFNYAKNHIFGIGGGFWSARETYMSNTYTNISELGLFGYLFASSGVAGAFVCAFLLVKNVILFVRLKNITSAAGILLCIVALLLPFGENIAVLIFMIGLISYNEQLAGVNAKEDLTDKAVKGISYGAFATILVSLLLFSHSIVRISASNAYNNEDYHSAYSLYKVAGTLNPADSESLRMSATCLRKTGEIKALRDTAIELVERASRKDENNLQNLYEKALIYDACDEFELCAQQYRIAAQRSFNADNYNLLLSKELFKIVEKSPKGSVETKRAYEELIAIAQRTISLDCKKEINDIADEAFKYTKGEIVSE